jgi:hypothetical protein
MPLRQNLQCASMGPAPRAAPPQGGRAPGGPTRRTESRPPAPGVAPTLRGCARVARLVLRRPPGAHGGSLHGGDVAGCQVPRAPQAGQCDGVSPVGGDPIPGWWGAPGGRDDPAPLACLGCETGRAKSHTGQRHRPRPGAGWWMAADGGGERCHPVASLACRARRPRRGVLARQRRRPSSLDGPPCRRRACEPVSWRTSGMMHAAACGGSSFKEAHPRCPRRSASQSEVMMSRLLKLHRMHGLKNVA